LATDALITVATGGAGKVFNKVASKVSQHLDDALDVGFLRISAKGEVGNVLSRSENISHIGSKHPNPEIQKNIEDRIQYIIENPTPTNTQIKKGNGAVFENLDADLPSQTVNGEFIKYKEYRVGKYKGADNVHRIVVGSDGKYYYTNTHYGTSKVHKGIPFYEAGKLPAKTIEKIFK